MLYGVNSHGSPWACVFGTWSAAGASALGTFKGWGRVGESRLLGRGTGRVRARLYPCPELFLQLCCPCHDRLYTFIW